MDTKPADNQQVALKSYAVCKYYDARLNAAESRNFTCDKEVWEDISSFRPTAAMF